MNDIHDLVGVDLNLFVAFDALARERSVTLAARRLGVTQSAMSHTLRRLRELLGDPLLVRGQGGMVLTPRAEALVVPLRSSLVALGRTLTESTQFDPKTAERTFRLATPDLFDVLAIPPLLHRIRKEAPNVDLHVVPVQRRRLADELETGDVDLAVIPESTALESHLSDAAPGLSQRTLFREGYVCLLRAAHPVLGGATKLGLKKYLELGHVLISPSGEGPGVVDSVLEQMGKQRRIALRIPHFYPATAIVKQSDLVLTAPRALASLADRGLAVVPVPVSVPKHTLKLLWHQRFGDDAGHRWLRELLTDIAKDVHQGVGGAP